MMDVFSEYFDHHAFQLLLRMELVLSKKIIVGMTG